jgi:hypothetical protein
MELEPILDILPLLAKLDELQNMEQQREMSRGKQKENRKTLETML